MIIEVLIKRLILNFDVHTSSVLTRQAIILYVYCFWLYDYMIILYDYNSSEFINYVFTNLGCIGF